MAQKNLKSKPKEETKKGYFPKDEEKKVFDQFTARKRELLNSRKNVHGVDLDAEMRQIDNDYFNRTADIPASELDTDQTPIAVNNAFSKVQVVLSILIDRNPNVVLDERSPKYSANRELLRALSKESWRRTNSLQQFRLSVFNMAKRGWMVGRTFNRKLQHQARFPQGTDEDRNTIYKESTVTKMDDVAYMNLDNRNTWIDEEARPGDMLSIRDWMYREVWHIDKIKTMFPESEFPNMKFVNEGGDTRETIEGRSQVTAASSVISREQKKGLTEIFFYEHQYDDWFIIEINKIMVYLNK